MDRALIVSGSAQAGEQLGGFLHSYGCTSLTTVVSGSEARRLLGTTSFPLILVNTPLTDEFGHDLAVTAAESTGAGILLLCKGDIAEDMAEKVGVYGVCVLPRPIDRASLHQSLRLVEATAARIAMLQRENSKLQGKLEEMRLVSRAKCVLMEQRGMTEPEAHRWIEKQSMDGRTTRRETAARVLAQYGA